MQLHSHTDFSQPSPSIWETMQWEPSNQQFEQMRTLQTSLQKWNSQINLTKLIEGEDYWISQIFDSLWPLSHELSTPQIPLSIIDVGTGCGFPGLAVAIALPKAKLTLIESVRKKTDALKGMVKDLGLNPRVTVRTERVETTGHDKACRGKFDLAMARAVASCPVLAEYLIPLIKTNKEALLFRGQWNLVEEKKLIEALKPLKSKIIKVESIQLPNNRGLRHQIRVKKDSECPTIYPRSIGIPTKRPLGTMH
ncbi:16S rRNA (guanine(527)-N(7))-methyltransferase RsmG [Prochlorococcus sp. MIT 1300]|uniref:16S rRNA (guanine(527)-N(7))-methyltransferase RsmG n=1 Tax=Prochlorococcus sp. MIT 1300 TaxID=3096218 RepID=UPI002A75E3AB|nr:16S rRNA (guanine(527)-N(7))-methyltransferase RsmG [Prochlorococcus sp. MIT 1300]